MSSDRKYLIFDLDSGQYAVNLEDAAEVVQLSEITNIPSAPAFVKGVINLRGSIVPLVDLRIKFGLGEADCGPHTCVIIVETEFEGKKKRIGVIVDTVWEVLSINRDEILPPPQILGVKFIKGVFDVEGKTIWLLDLDKVLAFEDIIFIKETLA